MQAWSMTHYVVSGEKTKSLERLTGVEKFKILTTGPTVTRPQNKLNPADYGLQLRTVAIASSDGIILEVWRADNSAGAAILMFPGYANSRDTLLRVAAEFMNRGFEPWLVDFRGCGGSTGNVTTIGWKEADDVAATVAAVRAENPARKILLYGQSLGSAAILRAVGTGGANVDGIIAEAPFDSLLNTIGNRFSAMKLPRFPLAHLLCFWGGAQHGFNAFAHSPADFSASIKVPTLVMMGENDARVGLDAGRRIAAKLGPLGTFHIFAGKRHAFLYQDATEEWRGVVSRFLKERLGMESLMSEGVFGR
ncbi:MAG: hypothetical protein RL088_3692 [Verrucomicrobiota bacterium]|jgi:alpha-beta hydrolase superfamily lysophospholipase